MDAVLVREIFMGPCVDPSPFLIAIVDDSLLQYALISLFFFESINMHLGIELPM